MSETYDKLVKPIKQDIFADLVNALATQSTAVNAPDRPLVILEVGIGAAPNLPYYAEAVAKAPVQLQQPVVVVGVDPNPEMLKGARETVTGAQLPPGWAVELFEGSAEALPFEDGSVDAVVVTTVGYTVASLGRAGQSRRAGNACRGHQGPNVSGRGRCRIKQRYRRNEIGVL